MNQQRYDELERELIDGEREFEAHNETKPCDCALCGRYRRISREYQNEQSRRCAHV